MRVVDVCDDEPAIVVAAEQALERFAGDGRAVVAAGPGIGPPAAAAAARALRRVGPVLELERLEGDVLELQGDVRLPVVDLGDADGRDRDMEARVLARDVTVTVSPGK
jgi:hypothetical protein